MAVLPIFQAAKRQLGNAESRTLGQDGVPVRPKSNAFHRNQPRRSTSSSTAVLLAWPIGSSPAHILSNRQCGPVSCLRDAAPCDRKMLGNSATLRRRSLRHRRTANISQPSDSGIAGASPPMSDIRGCRSVHAGLLRAVGGSPSRCILESSSSRALGRAWTDRSENLFRTSDKFFRWT